MYPNARQDGSDAGPAVPAQRGRELELANAFVALAGTLDDDHDDVAALLGRLVVACVALLDVTAAGLLLEDEQGELVVAASSDDRMRLLETFQLGNDEGPSLDSLRSGSRVVAD